MTLEFHGVFFKPASCSSVTLKCQRPSPSLVWFASSTSFFFSSAIVTSCGSSASSGSVSPSSRCGSRLSGPPTWQFMKTQRHEGENTQWRCGAREVLTYGCAVTVTLSSVEDVPLTHQQEQKQAFVGQEDVTKQMKSESPGWVWGEMKMYGTPLCCSWHSPQGVRREN